MTQVEKPAILKYYRDKVGREIELWKTSAGYEIVVKLDGVVVIVERYDRERSAKKRYNWYVMRYIRGDVGNEKE